MAARPGVLLVNLGTPDAPTPAAVRRYLREFLSDPRVVDISPLGRWLLLNVFILPVRPARSAAAYQKVWMPEGSPLLVHSRALASKVREQLDGVADVELAMRYGSPSLPDALDALRSRGAERICVVPLYPQYAASSTSSTLARVYELAAERFDAPHFVAVEPFFDEPGFLDAFAQVATPALESFRADHVLFSFHGLPERQIRKSDPTPGHCLSSPSCCDQLTATNARCYRAQCYFTARELAARLALPPERYTVSFQSRLGRTPWIPPYTDLLLPELAQRGVRRLAVLCPAFVADCLETLEEIGIRANEAFRAAGGEALTLVPSLNAHPAWVETVVSLIRRALALGGRPSRTPAT